jgi:hypothetical protein
VGRRARICRKLETSSIGRPAVLNPVMADVKLTETHSKKTYPLPLTMLGFKPYIHSGTSIEDWARSYG